MADLDKNNTQTHDDDEDLSSYKTKTQEKLDDYWTRTKQGLMKALVVLPLMYLLDYCDVITFKGERIHIVELPVIEMNDTAFNRNAIKLESYKPMLLSNKVKVVLRNTTDTPIANIKGTLKFRGSRINGTVDFDTKWSYLVIHPNETKTIKLRDFSDELGGGGFRVSLKLQSYSRYDDYERIYK